MDFSRVDFLYSADGWPTEIPCGVYNSGFPIQALGNDWGGALGMTGGAHSGMTGWRTRNDWGGAFGMTGGGGLGDDWVGGLGMTGWGHSG